MQNDIQKCYYLIVKWRCDIAIKNANVMARIEPEIKNKAEEILSSLGITSSGAINMLYRQIVMNNGLPFSLRVPTMPVAVEDMTQDEFDNMINKGLDQAKHNQGMKLEDAFEEIRGSVKREKNI